MIGCQSSLVLFEKKTNHIKHWQQNTVDWKVLSSESQILSYDWWMWASKKKIEGKVLTKINKKVDKMRH